MKKLLSILFFLLVASAPCTAQLLIPYLGKNGLTGFADVDGKVVVQPQFTDVQEYFHPKLPAVRAKKDGQVVWVLRNGAAVPDPNYQGQTMYALNHPRPSANAPTDTLKHLSVVYFRDRQVLVHLRTGKRVEFLFDPANGIRPWFPMVERPVPRNGGYAGNFLHGLMQVGRPGGLVNYVDTSLNLVFPQDYPAMTTAGPNAFLVANAEHKVAIADRMGRILTPFKFGILVPTDRKGYYIANPPVPGVELGPGVKTGVVNTKGEYVIPAIYNNLRPAGERFFIATTVEGEGVVDFAGKTVMPPKMGQLSFAEGDAFIHVLEGKRRIVRVTGEPLVDEEFLFLSWVEKSANRQPHFRFQTNNSSGAIAPDGRLIFRDSVARHILTVNYKDKTFFITNRKGNEGKELHGLVDFSGREVLPMQFEEIDQGTSGQLLKVKKNGRWGYVNMEGKAVIPTQFEELMYMDRPDPETGAYVFGREAGKPLWLCHDEHGQRVPEKDCLHPTQAKTDLVYVPNLLNKPTTIITKENGEMPLPDELRVWKNPVIKGAETPAGLMVAAYSTIDKHAFFYDKDMKPLLPNGFHVPIEYFNHGSFTMLEITGLLTVYQYEGSLPDVPALEERVPTSNDMEEMPNPRHIPHPDEVPMVEDMVQEEMKMPDVMEEKPTYTHTGTGVMNAKGEWVIKPKADARFLPISWNLVIEFPLDGPQKNHPLRMHRVNHPQPATFDITGADWNYDGRDEPDNFKAYLRKGTNTPQQQTFYTWFTYEGEQLASFHFTHGPGRLKSHNVVRSLENGQPRWLIVDNRCRLIATLDGVDDAVAVNQMPYFKKGYAIVPKNGLFGVVDSTGKEVLPFRFKNLSMDEYGPYLREFDSDTKKWRLLDWQGQLLYESDYHIETRLDEKSGTQMIGFDMNSKEDYRNARMLFRSPEGKALGEVRGHYSGFAYVPDRTGFYKFMGPDGKEFWVDVKRGLEYKER